MTSASVPVRPRPASHSFDPIGYALGLVLSSLLVFVVCTSGVFG